MGFFLALLLSIRRVGFGSLEHFLIHRASAVPNSGKTRGKRGTRLESVPIPESVEVDDAFPVFLVNPSASRSDDPIGT